MYKNNNTNPLAAPKPAPVSKNNTAAPVPKSKAAVPDASAPGSFRLSRRDRRILAAKSRNGSVRSGFPAPKDPRQISSDVHVYTDDSYKNRAKVAYTAGMKQVKERLAAINAKYKLPAVINTACLPLFHPFSRLKSLPLFRPFLRLIAGRYTSVLVINRDGKPRDFLPDSPGDHRILCHRSIAKHLVSGVCMLVRITANEDADGNNIDGSWAIVPAQYAMMRTTTIQHLRRRPFFFLHRYWYEISFDGRVQPAHMLFDYNTDPLRKRTRFYVTHEYVPVRKHDETNDYFRFWLKKPKH